MNSRLGRADNQRFLEHFRYLLVASQLLNEPERLRAAAIPQFAAKGPPIEFQLPTVNVTGAALTGVTAFTLVWLIHWSRRQTAGVTWSRFSLVVAVFAAVATAGYAYMRRQWLQYLRQQAVQGASTLVTNLQAFEASTSSALALVQEVELVSRGYRLCVNILPKHPATPLTLSRSSPLPPLSRIEEKGQARRCHRLRRTLHSAYAATIPVFLDQSRILKQSVEEDDLERYLDVYDVSNPDLQDAAQGYLESEFEDNESLKASPRCVASISARYSRWKLMEANRTLRDGPPWWTP